MSTTNRPTSRDAASSFESSAFWFLRAIPALIILALSLYVVRTSLSFRFLVFATGMGIVLTVIAATLLRGFAAIVRVQSEHAEILNRLESRLSEGLQRITTVMENTNAVSSAPDAKLLRLSEIRLAIRQARWDAAEEILVELRDAHPDDLEAQRLAKELDEAKRNAGRELLAKIDAAREVNDPERVIEIREAIRPLVEIEKLRTLDRELAKWFMTLIHRRLRTGTVRADVAVLAARVAAILDETPEGASLRASLPTLRRAAGLCARCGQPYTGVADACPACLVGALGSTGFVSSVENVDPDAELEPFEKMDEFGMGQLGD